MHRFAVAVLAVIAAALLAPGAASALTFDVGPSSPLTGPTRAQDLETGDFNEDGRQDLLVSSLGTTNADDQLEGNGVYLWFGGADGGMAAATGPEWPLLGSTFGSEGTNAMEIGQFNPAVDQHLDIVVQTAPGSIDLATFFGDGQGGFERGSDIVIDTAIVPNQFASMAKGDFNGDGFADLVFGGANGNYGVQLSAGGDGSFTSVTPQVTTATGAGNFRSAATGDFDGDGKVDVAFASRQIPAVEDPSTWAVYVFEGLGNGRFADMPGSRVALPGNARPLSIEAGNLNDDGLTDLAVSAAGWDGASPRIQTLLGHSQDLLTAQGAGAVDTRSNSYMVRISDLDGDGKRDVAGPNVGGGGSVTVGLGDGKGGVSAAPRSPYLYGPSPDPQDPFSTPTLATGDFNGDGKPDFASGSFDITDNPGYRAIPYLINTTAPPTPPSPPVELKGTLKLRAAKKVRAGKVLKVAATIRNTGNTALSSVSLTGAVKRKLAAKPKRVRIASLAAGQTAKRVIRVNVRRKARGGAKLRVGVTLAAKGVKLKSARVTARVKGAKPRNPKFTR